MSETIAPIEAGEPDRTCSRCKVTKPASEFHRKGKRQARHSYCRVCRAVARGSRKGESYTPSDPDAVLRGALRRRYGITLDQYTALLSEQGGVCAICGTAPGSRRLAVDHCHRTRRVRALLCDPCNLAIGAYELVKARAEVYLGRYGAGNPLLRYERD